MALQNLPKFGIFGLKTNHLATLNAKEPQFLLPVGCSRRSKGCPSCDKVITASDFEVFAFNDQ
jgi:hypothetical protein